MSTRLRTHASKGKRLGVQQGSAGGTLAARYGLMANVHGYPMMVDRRYSNPAEDMMNDIRSGEIDAGVLWGPIAAYWAARDGDKLVVVPLVKEVGREQDRFPHHDGRPQRRRRVEATAE